MASFADFVRKGLFHTWRRVFARPFLRRVNLFLYQLCLRGLGILNYESDAVSGEAAFLGRVLAGQVGAVLLDVGAHSGRYAGEALRTAPTAVLHAFEPHPQTFMALKKAAEKHGFSAHNVGCGAQPSHQKLYDYADQVGAGSEHASLLHEAIENIAHATSASTDVEIITLDQFCTQAGIGAIRLLKIDAEGYELEILKGAKGLISRRAIDVIQFEFNAMNVYARVFMRDFFDVLPEYRLYRLLPNGVMPLGAYDPVKHEIFAYQNIVAVREGVAI